MTVIGLKASFSQESLGEPYSIRYRWPRSPPPPCGGFWLCAQGLQVTWQEYLQDSGDLVAPAHFHIVEWDSRNGESEWLLHVRL